MHDLEFNSRTYKLSLFYKIKPEILICIYNDQAKYPHRCESIIKALKNNIATGDLPIDVALSIFNYSVKDNPLSTFTLSQLYNCFK